MATHRETGGRNPSVPAYGEIPMATVTPTGARYSFRLDAIVPPIGAVDACRRALC